MTLISELTELLIKSRDPEELRHVWIEWRRKTGEQVRGLYQQYVDLSNKAAQLNSTCIDAKRNQLKANR
jgi:peptidyl-dipeptidase A